MKLHHSLHLAYCTNVHRGESWAETFRALETYALAVRAQVCPQKPFAIGLRLSERAAVDLSEGDALLQFQRWLEKNNCYVFTINGFPYGNFHDARVKEKVYQPDWTSPERVAYTNLLFDLLAQLLPAGIEGSVSTLPGTFKEFHPTAAAPPFANTNDHLLGILDLLQANPQLCSHLEMETYTWEVLPPALKTQNVVDQLAAEYTWTLAQLTARGLA